MLPNNFKLWLRIVVYSLLCFTWPITQAQGQDELTSRDKKTIRSFEKYTRLAAEQLQNQKPKPAASAIKKALTQLKKLVKKPNTTAIQQITNNYQSLESSYQQVVKAGIKLPDLPSLPTSAANEPVGFVDDVAPILTAKCGNCHVDRQQGGFSLVSFNAINTGGGVVGGQPDNSRLIAVIESGEMPQGGAVVSPAELNTLKTWIAAGAKFDGPDAGQRLPDLVPPPADATMPAVNQPAGNETISFAEDLAPVLVENCRRCHMVSNPRGRFSMASFRTLLRGGNSGPPIKPGDVAASRLVNHLRGDGVSVMPPGNPLSNDMIKKFEIWIAENATFDGDAVQTPITTVASVARANAMTHEQAKEFRKQTTEKLWKLVMGGQPSPVIASENFFVTGNVESEQAKSVSQLAEQIAQQIQSTQQLGPEQPLVRGNVTVFVFQKRYDFGEFGRMVEKREFPRSVSSHWQYSAESVYLTVLLTRNQQVSDVEVTLGRQLAALQMASRADDVPRWFADGIGWMFAESNHPQSEAIKMLAQRAGEATEQMKNLNDFATDRIDGEQAALVGFLFVKYLKRKKSRAYQGLLDDLKRGNSFNTSFSARFGMSVEKMLGQIATAVKRQRR